MIQDARGWCTGMTQRDEMGKQVEGGFRMGNTCTPVEDSCQCMAKPIQYYKVISLIKINKFIFKKINLFNDAIAAIDNNSSDASGKNKLMSF